MKHASVKVLGDKCRHIQIVLKKMLKKLLKKRGKKFSKVNQK